MAFICHGEQRRFAVYTSWVVYNYGEVELLLMVGLPRRRLSHGPPDLPHPGAPAAPQMGRMRCPLEPALGPAKPDPGAGTTAQRGERTSVRLAVGVFSARERSISSFPLIASTIWRMRSRPDENATPL